MLFQVLKKQLAIFAIYNVQRAVKNAPKFAPASLWHRCEMNLTRNSSIVFRLQYLAAQAVELERQHAGLELELREVHDHIMTMNQYVSWPGRLCGSLCYILMIAQYVMVQ